ncbi:hypothetical protein ACFLTB_04150 [Chloroflexota bacterium]
MNKGDRVKVIEGIHKGKTGEAIAPWLSGGTSGVEENTKGSWFIKFQSGAQELMDESFLEVIEPE